MVNKKIVLNHPCAFCKGKIYVGIGTIIENRPMHFECYKKEILQKATAEKIKERIDNITAKIEKLPYREERTWTKESKWRYYKTLEKEEVLEIIKEMQNGK